MSEQYYSEYETTSGVGARARRGTYIAQSSANLVDHSKVIEVEQIDRDALPKRPVYHVIKRIFDVVASAAALLVLAIPMAIVAIAIKLDSPGPVFFTQERLGKDGKPFMMTKFRSMYVDAEDNGAQWAQEEDPRITKVGKVLRNSRLDEVPQFWNVIKGDMSLVGPRPERAIFYDEFDPYVRGYRQRMYVTPGITGLAQVNGGYSLLPEEKIVPDLEYIKRQSLSLDAKILFKTVSVVFSHEGAY